jgi:Tfp pilus assembly protein PilO
MMARAPIIGALVAVLLAVAFWFLLYDPLREQQAELENETASLETQQQTLRNQISQLEEIQANEVEIRAALAQLEEYIPSGPAQPTAIRQLQQAADAAGVEILSVSFSPPTPMDMAPDTGEPGTVLASIPVTAVIEGGYFQAVDFYRRMEVDVPRALLIESLTLGEGGDGFPVLSSSWSGSLFAVVPSGAQPTAPEPEVDAEGADGEGAEGEEEMD